MLVRSSVLCEPADTHTALCFPAHLLTDWLIDWVCVFMQARSVPETYLFEFWDIDYFEARHVCTTSPYLHERCLLVAGNTQMLHYLTLAQQTQHQYRMTDARATQEAVSDVPEIKYMKEGEIWIIKPSMTNQVRPPARPTCLRRFDDGPLLGLR